MSSNQELLSAKYLPSSSGPEPEFKPSEGISWLAMFRCLCLIVVLGLVVGAAIWSQHNPDKLRRLTSRENIQKHLEPMNWLLWAAGSGKDIGEVRAGRLRDKQEQLEKVKAKREEKEEREAARYDDGRNGN